MSEHSKDQQNDDERLAKVLQPLAADAADVPQERIDRILHAAGEEFAGAGKSEAPVKTTRQPGRSRMIAKAVLGLSSLAACLALIVLGGNEAASGVTFSSILDQLSDADTVRLQVRKDGEQAEVLVWLWLAILPLLRNQHFLLRPLAHAWASCRIWALPGTYRCVWGAPGHWALRCWVIESARLKRMIGD